MSQMTISTIIPAYNAARTITRPVQSLLNQTRPSTEILIIDDGSHDDLDEALRPFGNAVTLVRKSNGGAASARNLGIDLAKGELIAFLDADDYWDPTKLARQAQIFEDYPQVEVAASRYFTQEPNEPRQLRPAHEPRWFDRIVAASGNEVYDLMAEFWTSTVMVRRKSLEGYRFYPGLEPAEDRDLWIRLIESCPIYLDSQPLATYVQEPGSLCRSNIDRDYANMYRVVQRHSSLLTPDGLRRWRSHVYRSWAACHLGNGDPVRAIRPAYLRLCLQPRSLEAWWIVLKCHVNRFLTKPHPSNVPRQVEISQTRSIACHRP